VTTPSNAGAPGAPTASRGVAGAVVGGRYTLTAPIGAGGMGAVWRAHDDLLRRDVAIKEVLLPPGIPPDDQAAMYERTLREARAAAGLSHPSVVRVYDVVTDTGRPWIVMELLTARSLADLVRDDGPLPSRALAKIGLSLLGALEAAHRAGVLHRDVKPANVLICSDGRCVLTDFGVARIMDDSSAALTSPGMVLGSPQYMSPERALGATFGPPSDLFSLGVTLYTAAEGRPPFDRGDPLATMHAVVYEDPEPPRRSPDLAPVLMGLLDKDPQRRWDVERTRAGLRTILAGSPAAATATAETAPLPHRGHGTPTGHGGHGGPPGGPVGHGGMGGPGGPASPYPGMPISGAPMSAQPMSGAPMSGQPMSGPPVSGGPVSGAAGYPPPGGPNATQAMPHPASGMGQGAQMQGAQMRPGRASVGVPQAGDPAGYDYGYQSGPGGPVGHGHGGHGAVAGGGQAGDGLLGKLLNRRRLGPLLFAAGAGVVALVLVLVAVGAAAGWFSGGGPKKHGGASPGPTNVQVYTDPHGFSADLPNSWKASQPSGDTTYFVQFTDPADEGAWIRMQMDNAGKRTAEAFLRSAGNGLAGNKKTYTGYQEVGLQTGLRLGGRPAAQLEYELTVKSSGQHRHALWLATVSGGKVYEVYMSVPESRFAAEKPVFDQAVSTFKFS
jgi:hypothetical protein